MFFLRIMKEVTLQLKNLEWKAILKEDLANSFLLTMYKFTCIN